MESLLNSLKAIKLWQVGVLVAVLLGAGATVYAVYELAVDSSKTGLGEDQQLIPVQRDNLTNEVSVNGSIRFPNRETLTFDVQGTVAEVLVEVGESVEQGQELARLDRATVASVTTAAAQARLNLQKAEDALATAMDPHTNLDIALTEADVANARLSLQDAEDVLDRLLTPTAGDIAQAEATVANARLSVQDAQDALAISLEATSLDIALAETAVTQGKIFLQDAEGELDTARSGPTAEDIASLQSQVDFATTRLANAKRDMSLDNAEWNTRVEAAQESFDGVLEGYQNVFQKWLGVGPAEIPGLLAPDPLLASWGVDLNSMFDPNQRFEDSSDRVLQGIPVDDPATPWNEFVVYAWMNLTLGDIVPTCEDMVVTSQTQCIRQQMDSAWDTLDSAAADRDTVETRAAKAIATVEDAVTRAEESLATAEESLADLTAGPDPLEIEAEEKELALAQADLDEAEARRRKLSNASYALENEAKEKQLALAQANLKEAEDGLAELGKDRDGPESEAQRKQVAVARELLAEAEDELAYMRTSADPLEVSLRETELARARLNLQEATEHLQGGTLTAPIKGLISAVNVEVDQEVGPRTMALEVVDPTVVEVAGIVDEIDVLFVRLGARASVTLDAIPSGVLEGTVSAIESAAQNQQGVVSYPISIQVHLPEGVELVEGLSATASIVLWEDEDVLLVPDQAIFGTFDQPLVRVMSGGSLEDRPVTLGNSDGFWTAVLVGLQEGDQVAIETTQASDDPFAQIRQRVQAGGFGGGGTFGSGGGGGFGRGGGRR